MGDEAQALSEQQDWPDDEYDMMEPDEARAARAEDTREEYKAQYAKNKKAKVGTRITCPVCGKPFKKKSYQHAFCSNKGKGNCKDAYWNSVDEIRSIRSGGGNLW